MRKIILTIISYFLLNFTFLNAQEDYIINYFKSFSSFEQKNYDLALNYIDFAISVKKQNTNLVIFKALVLEQKKEYQKAIYELKEIEQFNKQSLFLISRLYSMLKMTDSSVFYLNKYLSSANHLLKYQIVTDTAFDNIRQSLEWQEFWNKAKISSLSNQLNDAYFKFVNSQYLEAIDICNKIIKSNSKYYPAYQLKAEILANAGNYAEASENFEKAIQINPFDTEILNKTAFTYQKTKNYKKAVFYYSKSLNINALQPKIYYNYSYCLNENKQYDIALEKIEFYLNYFSTDIEAKYLKVKILINLGDYIQALRILNNMPEKEQKTADFYFLRGQIYLQTKSYEQSYYNFSQCLDINPKFTEVYYYRGYSSFYLNNTTKACQDWQSAIKNKDYRANEPFYKNCKE